MTKELSNDLFKECYVKDTQFDLLKDLAIEENWDYKYDDPKGKKYPILRNYIKYTYKRLVDLSKANPNSNYIYISDEFLSFNTGLLSNSLEDIYMIWHKSTKKPSKWISWGFFKESNIKFSANCRLTDRATFINSTDELILDAKLPIITNFDHILKDEKNKTRLPENFKDAKYVENCLSGAIQRMKKRLYSNYKLAVPHYYKDKIQLLLPISLNDNYKDPDIVLVLEKRNGHYRGTTCLTLDMAYNNARLIAKPETDWLAR